MKIAIVSINYAPELTGIGVYSTGMAEYWAAHGDEVVVHTGFPYYPEWAKREADRGKWFERSTCNRVDLRRSFLYVPRRPRALTRILHELSFVLTSTLSYAFSGRSDVTLIVSPPLLLGVPIALLARAKGSLAVLHVQDLQPDAALELRMLPAGFLARALYALERLNYRVAHYITTISDSMLARIAHKGVPRTKLCLFKNWADLETDASPGGAPDFRCEWALADRFVVLYSGNLGAKQGLSTLLDVAQILADEPRIAIVIVGSGGEREALAASARERGLSNLQFRAPVAKPELARLLATADVSVIPQRVLVQDLVLPSKLCNLLAAGRPVIAGAHADSEMGRLITRWQCGVLVPPEDPAAMAQAIRSLYAEPDTAQALAARGPEAARALWDRATILDSLREQLCDWLDPERKLAVRKGSTAAAVPGETHGRP